MVYGDQLFTLVPEVDKRVTNTKGNLIVSTTHKVKGSYFLLFFFCLFVVNSPIVTGLEFQHVVLLNDFYDGVEPLNMAKGGGDEINLIYVAATRAMETMTLNQSTWIRYEEQLKGPSLRRILVDEWVKDGHPQTSVVPSDDDEDEFGHLLDDSMDDLLLNLGEESDADTDWSIAEDDMKLLDDLEEQQTSQTPSNVPEND